APAKETGPNAAMLKRGRPCERRSHPAHQQASAFRDGRAGGTHAVMYWPPPTLAAAERHIAAAEDWIRKQRERIEGLSAVGLDTNEAQIFLRRTVALLEQMKVHRDALAEEMTFRRL